jgi:predicted nucleotidyltransferase
MDMREEWLRDLARWASNNESVREMWLFGSRADGRSTPESDVDIGLGLAPPVGKHDWALGNFFALSKQWQRELEAIVGRHVSLEPITPAKPGSAIVRKWELIWRREEG